MVLQTKKGYGYVLVVFDNFSNFGWTVPLKNKNAQIIKDSFEIFLISSNRQPNLIKSDREKEFYNSTIQNFLNTNNIKHFCRRTSFGAVLQNALIVLIEFFLKDQFLNELMLIGLLYYLQKRNNIMIEYIHRLNLRHFKLV